MKTLHTVTRTKILWIALALATIATILLAACGEATPTQSSSPTATSAPAATATQGTTPTTQPTATTTTPTQVVQVKIVENNNKYSFQPSSITVPKGGQVVWTNSSDAPHTVTSDTNAFTTSSSLNQNDTFKMVFATSGTFTYHCSIHTYMKATITVTA